MFNSILTDLENYKKLKKESSVLEREKVFNLKWTKNSKNSLIETLKNPNGSRINSILESFEGVSGVNSKMLLSIHISICNIWNKLNKRTTQLYQTVFNFICNSNDCFKIICHFLFQKNRPLMKKDNQKENLEYSRNFFMECSNAFLSKYMIFL